MPRCLFLNIIAAAILSLSPSSPARAVACGELPKTEVVQNIMSQALDTTSTGFFDVAGSTVSFSIGGSVKTCVLVNFSGEVAAQSNVNTGLMLIRAVRDNAILSADGEVQFVVDTGFLADAHAYNFIFPHVPPGPHSIKMQFQRASGNFAVIVKFDMVVRHQ